MDNAAAALRAILMQGADSLLAGLDGVCSVSAIPEGV